MLLCVGGVALGDIDLRFVWQAWRLLTSTFDFSCQAWPLSTSTLVLRGRRGAYGTGLDLVALLVAVSRPGRRGTWRHRLSFCVAGMALDKRFLRGIRVTWRHRPWFCVVGVALVALGWIWWRAWSPLVAQSAAALCFGRRCACSHPCCFCVAGVALGDIAFRFAWQAWRLVTSSFVLRGRHVTWRH